MEGNSSDIFSSRQRFEINDGTDVGGGLCGTATTALTVSISGPRDATVCTASLGLSDNGNVTCSALGKVRLENQLET